MADETTILVPIRYPLTEQSARTLATAGRLARDHTPVDLTVLHVNLHQRGTTAQKREITRAVSSTLDGVDASVMIRQGYLVEEEILEEATQLDADIIVVGTNQQATWRKILSRTLGNDPEVGDHLRENTTADTEIVEVDTATETPVVEPV
ncbi:universal stress protein [Halobacteriaceae archaeon SHR40]|uniref:universal stress protein n=1 Tax=Halovenus amylolytica TaxID=2500550 RepID=UPI000FE3AE45